MPSDSAKTRATRSGSQFGFQLGGATGGVDAALNERVKLYLRVTTIINVLFTAVGVTLWLGRIDARLEQRGPELAAQMVLLAAVNALAWFLMARSRPAFRVALLVQGITTLVISANYAAVALGPKTTPDAAAVVFVAFVLAIMLVLRSSLVPTPAAASTVIGLLSYAIAGAFGARFIEQLGSPVFVWSGALSLVVVGVTTLTSHTIYGLEHRVRATARLGQYQIERLLGQGSMGEVYLATHALLNRSTAVKLLRDASTTSARDRFRQEVQLASALTHPNTVDIYDYGRTPEGVFYFAMEFVEGATLEEVVLATGVMPPARVVHLLMQAAGSLSEAHGRGLVHRDVKPSNLMLCERGGVYDTLKVTDFGLVREIGTEASGEERGLTGTPLYLAPEAILDGDGFTPESDVYALGVTAYFLLTGRPPFCEGDLVEILSDHLVTAPAPLDAGDPKLESLVLRCLAKDPGDRPADAHALLEMLEACACCGEWRSDDAHAWWTEHREVVESHRRARSSPDQSRASSTSRAASAAS